MTIDMHLTLPPGFVEYTRRHVVQGKMGFAPMFFRLNQGYTEININGQSLCRKFLYSMFKACCGRYCRILGDSDIWATGDVQE